MTIKNKKSPIEQEKSNKSFLSKFKDKHSIVSKQGLLNLLQNKKKSLQNKMHRPHSISSEPLSLKSKIKDIQDKKISEIIKTRSQRKGSQASVSKSLQLGQIPKKLPAIQKSVSTTQNLRKKEVIPSLQIAQTQKLQKNTKKVPSVSKQKKNEQKLMFQLDKFALDHLDFLQRFQERIKNKDPITR